MDLVADLLPALVALYALDSAVRVRSGQVLFVSKGWGRFVMRGPGLHLAGLWPTAEVILTATLPLRATARGVMVRDRRGGERRVDFADIETVRAEDGSVRLGRGTRLNVHPRGLAAETAGTVEELKEASEPRRADAIRRALGRRCAVDELRRRRAARGRDLAVLKALSAAFFMALFVAVPVSLFPGLEIRPSPWAAAFVAFALYGAVLLASVRLLRGWGLPAKAVAGRILPLLLFPPAAAHAASQVCRELILGYEPAAAAAVLLDDSAFREVARRRRAERLLLPPEPGEDDDEAWNLEHVAWELVLEAVGQTDALLLVPPARADATAAAWCPICRAEYRPGFARCSDCGVALQAFPA